MLGCCFGVGGFASGRRQGLQLAFHPKCDPVTTCHANATHPQITILLRRVVCCGGGGGLRVRGCVFAIAFVFAVVFVVVCLWQCVCECVCGCVFVVVLVAVFL